MSKKILLTGGLGYIGSHIANLLKDKAVIIDNMSNSKLDYKRYLKNAFIIKKDVNYKNLSNIFKEYEIEGVIHLAGSKSVLNSIREPLKYYYNNFVQTLDMLEAIDKFKIKKLIFSSSATVYGNKNLCPIDENSSLQGINPYANTKIQIEKLLEDYCQVNKSFKAVSLRYFNPIGCDLASGLTDQPVGEPQNLVPILINSIINKKKLKIFGNDYNTPDGSCIRDYIHVCDLAEAHLIVFKNFKKIKNYSVYNIGKGRGLSVFELINIFEKTNQIKIPYIISNRRKGDVEISYASNLKMKKTFNWMPKRTYENMCYDSWNGHLKKNV